jgi:hypothetical protein
MLQSWVERSRELLAFQGRTFERFTSLNHLVAVAFDNVAERADERCVDLAIQFSDLPTFDPRETGLSPPTQAQRDEAFRLAEEIITRVISALPEDVQP